MPTLEYAPRAGNGPDPGEVVWTWVPYEEDHSNGKDRPVLIVGKDGDWLLGLQLTSQDHDLDKDQEAREGRYWIEIGRGSWDLQGRVSEARVSRIIRVNPHQVRRGGDRIDSTRFSKVAAAVVQYHRRQEWLG